MYDKLIIGAGLYGLYAALFCAKRGERVVVLECDSDAFARATYANQARVHMGYHYPRSISTAMKSRDYFDKFHKDYGFCIYDTFEKIYATSASFSWTSASQFKKFCRDANIPCDEISPEKYFKTGMCDGAFVTTEYAFDAMLLKKSMLEEIGRFSNVSIVYDARIKDIAIVGERYRLTLQDGGAYETGFVVNATYASVNQINELFGLPTLQIKYELCETIICKVNDKLQNTGITVMDGPFFSIMPFGKTGYHSLTSVTFTPHTASFDTVPTFDCQTRSAGYCSPQFLGNCNTCEVKPETAWEYMSHLAKKYLKDSYQFEYVKSLFSMKPILKTSEIDDSRPTAIRRHREKPHFVSVLSGKINTLYDLDGELIT